jgi:hypothetical protein
MKLQLTKKNKIRFIIEAAVLLIMIIAFVIINKKISKNNESKEKDGYNYYIDKLAYDDEAGEIVISGWCIKDGIPCPDESSRPNFKILLAKDGNRDNSIEIPVTSYERPDVQKAYGNESIDYTFSGFKGSLKADSSVKENKYRVLIQYDSSVDKYLYTMRYLDKGKLTTEYTQMDYTY